MRLWGLFYCYQLLTTKNTRVLPTTFSSFPSPHPTPNKKRWPNDHLHYHCPDRFSGRMFFLFNAVKPTIGLLPIPKKPIISTCAGTDEEPANCASHKYIQAKATEQHTAHCVGQSVGLWPTDVSEADFSGSGRK